MVSEASLYAVGKEAAAAIRSFCQNGFLILHEAIPAAHALYLQELVERRYQDPRLRENPDLECVGT